MLAFQGPLSIFLLFSRKAHMMTRHTCFLGVLLCQLVIAAPKPKSPSDID